MFNFLLFIKFLRQLFLILYNIVIASLYLNFPNEELEEVAIKNEDFYPRMVKEGIPIYSQPPVGIVYIMMEDVLKKGHDIIGVFLSQKMDSAFNSAQMIASKLRKAFPERKMAILDLRSNPTQLVYAAFSAAKLATKNVGFNKIVATTEANIEFRDFFLLLRLLNI